MTESQANGVQWRLMSLERRMEALETRTEILTELRLKVDECLADLEAIKHANERQLEAERRQRDQQVRDRKADRKWQLTVMAAWASAIIAAIAIIVPLLVGG
jgi:hypothetical protein